MLLAAFCAGFVDSIAGGGGLISLPVLIASGIQPHIALGTNKLQSSLGTTMAVWRYHRGGQIRWDLVWTGVAWTAVGSVLGAALVRLLDPTFVRPLVIGMLLAVLVWVAVSPGLGTKPRESKTTPKAFYCAAGLILGAYDGFFGPGVGSFWAVAQVALLGLPLLEATARTKVFNLTSNVASLAVFAIGGQVAWGVGLSMGAANTAGAWCGSHLALKRGQKLIRAVFLCVVAATLGVLVWRELGG